MQQNTQKQFPEKTSSGISDQGVKKTGVGENNIPQLSLPKGGGAIKSIDDKFSVNSANGTSALNIPFPFSPSRNSFIPSMSLGYNSGSGAGEFGLGWTAAPASITRKTGKKLPRYGDDVESDTFIFSGSEDLVPAYKKDSNGNWIKDESTDGSIKKYKPGIEGSFSRIEKITEQNGNVYWKLTSKDNIVSIFGKSKSAQLYDPTDDQKIFKWSIEFSYDDKGNCIQYGYKKEDKTNVPTMPHEKNRLDDTAPCTNLYLKRIKYCNKSHFIQSTINLDAWEDFTSAIEYMLELVLDYGDHDNANPSPGGDREWSCRSDPFSSYLSGFDIRTYRLCSRIVMYHNFPELGNEPCLVRSLDLDYEITSSFTFLKSIKQKGFIRNATGSYVEKSFPPMEFSYEKLGWDTTIKTFSKDSMTNLPVGIDDKQYQWIDLYNEGIAGVLTEQAGEWYYKANAGDGRFDPVKLMSSRPSVIGSDMKVHFQDLEANGEKQLVSSGLNGFYELTDDDEWQPFKSFNEIANINLSNQDLRMLDLTGDGKADILIAGENDFTWYPSKGKQGFDTGRKTIKTFNEEKGPAILFSGADESVVTADMSGDGLLDIVRIRNTNIVYWPNLGYGKFGAKVTMTNAPHFDNDENFNPGNIKLADLDGSGLTDIIYVGKDAIQIYFNQAGNSWQTGNIVNGINPIPFLKIDQHSKINIIDLLGTGTGCIVWSSPLPGNAELPLKYIDLMAGKKPHVLNGYKNGMGKEVLIRYKPSTHYYLEDKKNQTPWITKLPFPVQCVSNTETIDHIRKTRFTTSYKYHHGHYDHVEGEFRGFGRVDQIDTEDFENYKKNALPGGSIQIVDERLFMPPVLTKTWFHTGAFINKEKILGQFANEYFRNEIVAEKILAEPALDDNWSTAECIQGLRACKGMTLHTELYSLDGTGKENIPYTTANHTVLIQLNQPMLDNKHAVFVVQQREGLTYSYDRNPADPRIAHNMNIDVDEFGNILKSAAVSYGRKIADTTLTPDEQSKQARTHIVFTENKFTNKIDTATDYRFPISYETMTYELTGVAPQTDDYFSIENLRNDFAIATVINFEADPVFAVKEKRLLAHGKVLFLKNDLSGPLSFGEIESFALLFQTYKLALTSSLVQDIFGQKVDHGLLINKGKYHDFGDNNYWVASGTQTFDANNFYQVVETTDPFGFTTLYRFDTKYRLFLQETVDSLSNKNSILQFNFRTLSPALMQDLNNNRAAVRTDELGMVMSTFVMGKEGEQTGDLFYTASVESSLADKPGTILSYDLFQFYNQRKPNFSKTIVHETHHFESLLSNTPINTQQSYSYYCGGGNEVMKKLQSEPGIALQENPDGSVAEIDTTPSLRWIGNGRSIINNKGKIVKQYEPYFSATFEYEDSALLVERGVTPVVTYDPVGRITKTFMPDDTFSIVEFDSWKQLSYDPNDNVSDSKWYSDRVNNTIDNELMVVGKDPVKEKEAAEKALAHNNTPQVVYLDSLGRPFLLIADNGVNGTYRTSTELGITSTPKKITDARGNDVMKFKYDMLGTPCYTVSMDAGERWLINDAMGRPLNSWDSKSQVFSFEYDELHRLKKSFVAFNNGTPVNFEKIVYGENIPNDKKFNLRGKTWLVLDGAGIVNNTRFDFKGNLLESTRELCKGYDSIIDWTNLQIVEDEKFTTATTYDAVNRPLTMVTPDKSIVIPGYNETGQLEMLQVQLKGNAVKTVFVKDISYNAKGQREHIIYGNDVKTTYQYDKKTFRLIALDTKRKNETEFLQQLRYTYDCVGNISFARDSAQQTFFFNNQVVEPSCDFTYDALYQLIRATGREHIGQNQLNNDNWNDEFFTNLPHKGDGNAMRNYIQEFLYDEAGNIKQLKHSAGLGSYTRDYHYESSDNRLLQAVIANNTFMYQHDIHGNINQLPHLTNMQWNYKDHLQSVQQTIGNGERTFYVYDGSGQRVRKVTLQQGSNSKKEERIYLGGVEIFRKYKNDGTTIELERETIHILDDKRRIALVETKVKHNGSNDTTTINHNMVRYQFANHLGSSALEINESGQIVSYEEYHPYGTTAYQAINNDINPIRKHYRYTAMERDEESGMEYHNARYYLPWLARWMNVDPLGLIDGSNMFRYSRNNPLRFSDTSGTNSDELSYIGFRHESLQGDLHYWGASGGGWVVGEYDPVTTQQRGTFHYFEPKGKIASKIYDPETDTWLDNEIIETQGFAPPEKGGFIGGIVDAGFHTVVGLGHMVTHPKETAKGIGYMVTHPKQTAKAIGSGIKSRAAAIWSGDSHAAGATFFDIASFLYVPEAKAAEITKVAEMSAEAARVAQLAEEAAKVAHIAEEAANASRSLSPVVRIPSSVRSNLVKRENSFTFRYETNANEVATVAEHAAKNGADEIHILTNAHGDLNASGFEITGYKAEKFFGQDARTQGMIQERFPNTRVELYDAVDPSQYDMFMQVQARALAGEKGICSIGGFCYSVGLVHNP
jgi:RHS repeat-associated protein